MAKKPPVICRICKETIDRNVEEEGKDWIMPSRNWYFHTSCYNDWQAKKDNVKTDVSDEALWEDAAYQYLKRDLLISIDYGKFNSQWKNLIKKGKTPKGIYFALRYFYSIQNGDRDKAQGGIGIVSYVYSDSCEYWARRERNGERILEQIEQQIKLDMSREKIVVPKHNKKNKKKVINFEDIERMEFDGR